MDVLVPPMAFCLGVLAAVIVYRHATRHHVRAPLLWSGFVGGTFFLAPIVLTPFLIPVYYILFIPLEPGLLVKPLHALATILGGGMVAGGGAALLYFTTSVLARRRAVDADE